MGGREISILVINLGLKANRAIVFDLEGRKLASHHEPVKTIVRHEIVEQDPSEWWTKTKEVLDIALMEESIRSSIKYLTVTSSSSCLVCVDKKLKPLINTIMVPDKRAQEQSKFIDGLSEFDEVKTNTGMRMDSSLMIPRIKWIQDTNPLVYDQAYKFIQPNDFFIMKFTGKCITDSLSASKYHTNPETDEYPKELLNVLNIDESKLPEVRKPGFNVGRILGSVAKQLNLPKDTEVILSTYDALCSIHGSGVTSPGDACDVSGTVTSVRALTDKNVIDPLKRVYRNSGVIEGQWFIGGSNNMGGGLIEWTKEVFLPTEKNPYSKMEHEAKLVSAGSNGVIFLPYLLGERCPVWDPYAKGVFFGLDRGHSRKQLIKAVFEAAGYATRHIVDVLNELGVHINRLYSSGGLTRLETISQIKADILGKEVVLTEEFESSALGAAMIALLGIGVFKNLEEASKMVRIKKVIKPNMENYDLYNRLFDSYKSLYTNLKGQFKKQNETIKSYSDILNDHTTQLQNL